MTNEPHPKCMRCHTAHDPAAECARICANCEYYADGGNIPGIAKGLCINMFGRRVFPDPREHYPCHVRRGAFSH